MTSKKQNNHPKIAIRLYFAAESKYEGFDFLLRSDLFTKTQLVLAVQSNALRVRTANVYASIIKALLHGSALLIGGARGIQTPDLSAASAAL